MATIDELVISIGVETGELRRGLARAESRTRRTTEAMRRNFVKVGRSVRRVSRELRGTAIAAGVLGAASFKLASDFDASFAKIEGLVGVASDRVKELREETLRLAPQVGKGPGELADAMFFITSAGLRGADALDTLEASAKASVAGLGEVATIADAVTSAINAYGTENIDAATATGILVAAVREGKLEASELSGVMGGVLPIASELGIEFHEVAAAIAAMSRSGVNASEGATALRGIMSALLRPTAQSEKALAGVATSLDEVRRKARDEGLLVTLQSLKDQFDGNVTAMGQVFTEVRGLSGVLNLTGASAAQTRNIFAALEKTTGRDLDAAFDKVSKNSSAQLEKAISSLRTTMVELGTAITPLVVKGLKLIEESMIRSARAGRQLAFIWDNLGTAIDVALEQDDIKSLQAWEKLHETAEGKTRRHTEAVKAAAIEVDNLGARIEAVALQAGIDRQVADMERFARSMERISISAGPAAASVLILSDAYKASSQAIGDEILVLRKRIAEGDAAADQLAEELELKAQAGDLSETEFKDLNRLIAIRRRLTEQLDKQTAATDRAAAAADREAAALRRARDAIEERAEAATNAANVDFGLEGFPQAAEEAAQRARDKRKRDAEKEDEIKGRIAGRIKDQEDEVEILKQKARGEEKYVDLLRLELELKREGVELLPAQRERMKILIEEQEHLENIIELQEAVMDSISQGIEDLIVNGGKVSDVLKQIEADLIRIILRKTALEPLGDFVSGVFKSTTGGGGGGGGGGLGGLIATGIGAIFGGGFSGAATPPTGVFTGDTLGFNRGGSFTVGGTGGPDSVPVPMMLTPGEHVRITPAGRTSNSTLRLDAGAIMVNVSTNGDSDSARLSGEQIGQDIVAQLAPLMQAENA